ncbi:hypothetical protein RHSIM_Rhsim08G0158700 [Rhododendron simsii]|uniref:Uncharacterized protein n=1 Tax=Rhododendron simsii TaxID=118357 RepID=A0A834GLT9_RHOSS|nr:hypothetical protein RHSIM_Rhsim08G0158700 [Rhododendron simsii]
MNDDKDASRIEKERLMVDMAKQRNEAMDDMENQRNMEAEKGDNSVINGLNQQIELENVSNQKCALVDQEKAAGVINRWNLQVDLNPSAVWRTIRSQQLEAPLSNERDDNDVSGYVMDTLEPEQDLIAKELQASTIERITLDLCLSLVEPINYGGKRMVKFPTEGYASYRCHLIGVLTALKRKDHAWGVVALNEEGFVLTALQVVLPGTKKAVVLVVEGMEVKCIVNPYDMYFPFQTRQVCYNCHSNETMEDGKDYKDHAKKTYKCRLMRDIRLKERNKYLKDYDFNTKIIQLNNLAQ